MKLSKYILGVILLICSNGKSQSIAYPELASALKVAKNQFAFEKWYKHDDGLYAMSFKHNIVGFKKAVDKCKNICNYNSLDFESPSKDDSFLSSAVDSINDFENLYYSVKNGSSVIEKYWFKIINMKDGTVKSSALQLTINDEAVILAILNN